MTKHNILKVQLLTILGFILVFALSNCCEQELVRDECVCPDNRLQLNCTTSELVGLTIWTLDLDGCTIRLRNGIDPDTERCNDFVIATGLPILNDSCYTSQLIVRGNSLTDLKNTNINCTYDDGNITLIGSYLVMLEPELSNNVTLKDISSEGLTFSWNVVAPNCSTILYDIIASDGCGICPNQTNMTTATCSDVHLTDTVQTCNFSIQPNVCEDAIGSLTLTIPVETSPEVNILPKYRQNTTHLISFNISINKLAPISISGINITQSCVVDYSTNSDACIPETRLPCLEGVCRKNIELVPPCVNGTDILVNVSVTNVLETGTESQFRIGGTYTTFISVIPNVENDTITCIFRNELDISNKTCVVSYGPCGEPPSQTAHDNSSSEEPNVVRLSLNTSEDVSYCYIVMASNYTYTILVEGYFDDQSTGSPSITTIIVAAVVGAAVVIAAAVITTVILGFLCKNKLTECCRERFNSSNSVVERESIELAKKRPEQKSTDDAKGVGRSTDGDSTDGANRTEPSTDGANRTEPSTDVASRAEHFTDGEVSSDRYQIVELENDCGLDQFFKDKGFKYSRGCAFYEFKNDTEDIRRDAQIILVKKVGSEEEKKYKYFSGEEARRKIMLPASTDSEVESKIYDEIKKPNNIQIDNEVCDVFVQCQDLGRRFYRQGSRILIDTDNIGEMQDVESDRFTILHVTDHSHDLRSFIESHKLVYERGCAFYEFVNDFEKISDKKEVVFRDVKNGKLYTGEITKLKIGAPGPKLTNPYKDKKKWQVFVQSHCIGHRCVEKGTDVLFEDPRFKDLSEIDIDRKVFHRLHVKKTCSLRQFVTDNGLTCKEKYAYYEFTYDNEDIRKGKEVLLMDKKSEKLYTGSAAYRMIGAPADKIPCPPGDFKYRVFVQVLSAHGSRCLQKGTTLLYKKE